MRWMLAFAAFVILPFRAQAQQVAPPDAPRRFALVVGVSDYVDSRIVDVPNARADAEAIRDWLTTVGGVPTDDVMMFLDDGADTLADAREGEAIANTRANLLEATERWLGERTKPGDTVFVYFSGQATAQGDRPILLTVDAREPLPADTGVSLPRIGATLAALEVVPVVWLDTSPAGRGTGTGVTIETDSETWFPSDERVVWTATAPDQVAGEAPDSPHGAFTDALLRALRGANGRVGRTELQLTQSIGIEPFVDRTTSDRFALAALGTEAAQRPEVVPQSGHGNTVTALAWHPHERWLASGDATGVVQIADVAREQIRVRLPSGQRGVYRLAFSPDGEMLFVAGRDGVLRAFRTADGDLLWDHEVGKLAKLRSLAVHDDFVAVGTSRGSVVVVDRITGERRTRFRIGESRRKLAPAVTEALAWTPRARHLLSAADNGELSLWFRGEGSLSKWSYQRQLVEQGPAIHDLALLAGRAAIGLSTGEVQVVRLEDGGIDATLSSTGYAVRRIAARPGHRTVAVAAGNIRLWNPGSTERTLEVPSPTSALAWSSDGASLVSGHEDGTLILWDAEGDEPRPFTGQAAGIRRISVEGSQLLVASEAGAHVWDILQGELVQRLATDAPVAALTTSSDEVVGGDDAGVLRAWNPRTGALEQQWSLEAPIRDVATIEAGVVAATDGFVEVVHAGSRRRWATRARRPVSSVTPCGPDGSIVLHTERGFRRHDPLTGERLGPRRHGGQVVSCSPDGTRLAVGRTTGAIELFDATKLERFDKLDQPFSDLAGTLVGDNRTTAIAWHPTEPLLASSRLGSSTRVWNLETGTRTVLPTFGTTAIAFGPGRLVVTGSSDGRLELWDLEDGQLVASLLALGDDWLAWTPDGLFDGSLAGRRDLFRWRIGDTMYPPSRFHRGFYRPGLLGALARGQRPRAQRDIADLAPPPSVTIVDPSDGEEVTEGTITVEIAVTDQGGGASDPRLYVNGHRVRRPGERGLAKPQGQGIGGQRVSFRVALIEGTNFLRATAFNEEGNWESKGAEATIEWSAPVTEAPKLHVLAVGIDSYENPRLDLDYARDDADAIGGFFEAGLFGEIVPHVLLDDEASLPAIRAAFDRVAATAAPRDALLVYLAGHGVLENDVFHFLPWDAEVGDSEGIVTTGFSQDELGERLASIPAMKQLIILDACHSGAASAALASLVGRRASPELVRAQTQLARSTGAFLIAASTEAQVAHEIPELGHGVLTYAILRGLGDDDPPEAHVNREGHVTVNTLIQFVSDLVPVLTDAYRQQRQEVVQAAEGQDFPLVRP